MTKPITLMGEWDHCKISSKRRMKDGKRRTFWKIWGTEAISETPTKKKPSFSEQTDSEANPEEVLRIFLNKDLTLEEKIFGERMIVG